MLNKKIPFSPPDITDLEINEVIDTLKSGWITTGPKTKLLENEIARYCASERAVCLNSATAGLELVLRLFEIKEGDEVITTPFTFAATGNVIYHLGAKPVFVDIKRDEFHIDPQLIYDAVTEKTKAVIPVDYGGWPCDYNEISQVLADKAHLYRPSTPTLQEHLDRPLLLIDAAHSFGAEYFNRRHGQLAPFTVFSFHAVKNLTTAEGGAVIFNSHDWISSDEIYKRLMLLSLHGQNKDALAKMKSGGWQYSIECPGYKCNMTDIMASLGLAQLKRYSEMLAVRKKRYQQYLSILREDLFILPPFDNRNKVNVFHLFPLRIKGYDEERRSRLIHLMGQAGVAANVHFIPLVMQPFYQKMGFSIKDFPNCYNAYKNEISLPLYSTLTEEDVEAVCKVLKQSIRKIG